MTIQEQPAARDQLVLTALMDEFPQHRPFATLYKYTYTENDGISVFEVKYLDVPSTAPPAQRFSWWWSTVNKQNETVYKKLEFKSMEEGKRFFQDGSWLDMVLMKYHDAEGLAHDVTGGRVEP